MTIHYHGTPISPRALLHELAGRFFCVSYARPTDVSVCHGIGQGVMLDNGAFSFWRRKLPVDWPGFYRFAERWLDHRTTWAVIPDVIDGDETINDALVDQWPHGTRGAPVWHMHEPVARLLRLAETWPRVCIGSSRAYKVVGSPRWHGKMVEAMNALCGDGPAPVWLHMLRGMALAGGPYPFASVDSTDIARNHNRAGGNVVAMAQRWDSQQCAGRWARGAEQVELLPAGVAA